MENEIAKLSLESSDVSSVLKRLQQTLDECTIALQKQNQLINKSEADIGRNNALIERKQTQIDQMNKKIEHTVREMGGVSSPMYMYSTCACCQEYMYIYM